MSRTIIPHCCTMLWFFHKNVCFFNTETLSSSACLEEQDLYYFLLLRCQFQYSSQGLYSSRSLYSSRRLQVSKVRLISLNKSHNLFFVLSMVELEFSSTDTHTQPSIIHRAQTRQRGICPSLCQRQKLHGLSQVLARQHAIHLKPFVCLCHC